MVPQPPQTAAASAVSSHPSSRTAAHQQQTVTPTDPVCTDQHLDTTPLPAQAAKFPASFGDKSLQHTSLHGPCTPPATTPEAARTAHKAAPAAVAPVAAAKPSSVHAVLFNAPNSVGWLRLLLMLAGIQQAAEGQASNAFWLFVISMSLDAIDGWLARRLGQATSFGALLDVVLDIWLRGWLWVNALPASVALVPPLLEMLVLTVTHKTSGADWKTSCFASAPPWVSAVMAGGGFRSPAGVLAIAGLMGCPLWLWAMRHLPGASLLTSPAWGLVLIPGRFLAAAVEVWVVRRYLLQLLQEDAATAAAKTK